MRFRKGRAAAAAALGGESPIFAAIFRTAKLPLSMSARPAAILLLEDGTIFHGKAVGKVGTTTGEICFNTGMTGYQEVFTDPSYFGQILVMTNVHIGNYGVRAVEQESDGAKIAGLVVRNFSAHYSRLLANGDLQRWLEEEGVVGIEGVDTRALVRHIRSKGAMNAIISSETDDKAQLRRQLEATPSMAGLELASKVTTAEPYVAGNPNARYRIAALDFGIKRSIIDCFLERDCVVKVFPAHTSFEEMERWQPDGYFLSNGPGDPAAMDYAVEVTRKILAADKPLFGICLGHQLLARAADIPTYKMHHGHRGLNHPVKNLRTGRGEITSQNHGFGVSPEAIRQAAERVEVTHVNLNDGTIEGIRLKKHQAFSVQYHPEASPGPHDARYLFDEFVEMLKKAGAAVG